MILACLSEALSLIAAHNDPHEDVPYNIRTEYIYFYFRQTQAWSLAMQRYPGVGDANLALVGLANS